MQQNIRTINIRGKQYVDVAERVRLVHESGKSFEISESGIVEIGTDTSKRWLYRVVVKVDKQQYIGTAEIKMNAPKNTPDGSNPFECAETSAIGRALGFAGFGSVESIASADEVIRAIAGETSTTQDAAPQPRKEPTPIQSKDAEGPATPDQLKGIQNLQKQLGLEPVDLTGLSYGDCAQLLKDYSQQLNAKRKAS